MKMLETIAAIATIIVAAVTLGPRLVRALQRRGPVTVTLKNGFLADQNYELVEELFLLVTSANGSDRAVILESLRLLLPDGRSLYHFVQPGMVAFPYRLDPGSNCLHWYSMRDAATALKEHGCQGTVRLIAVVQDQLGNKYRSNPYKLDVDEWTKEEVSK